MEKELKGIKQILLVVPFVVMTGTLFAGGLLGAVIVSKLNLFPGIVFIFAMISMGIGMYFASILGDWIFKRFGSPLQRKRKGVRAEMI